AAASNANADLRIVFLRGTQAAERPRCCLRHRQVVSISRMKRTTRVSRRDTIERPIAYRARRSPAQERSRTTVAAILEAATRIFAARGYAATTTNRIAEHAGVSVGSLYEYFPSKDAILVALAEVHMAEVRRVVREATEPLAKTSGDVEAVVRAVVKATVKLH